MKRLVLVRHAHRDLESGHSVDNGLSSKGKLQAQKICWFFLRREWEGPIALISSPKKRCLETLEPISKIIKAKVKTTPLLDEQSEGSSQFERRVKKFHSWWQSQDASTFVVCTHSDWLEVFAHQVLEISIQFKKGAICEIAAEKEFFTLEWLVQEVY